MILRFDIFLAKNIERLMDFSDEPHTAAHLIEIEAEEDINDFILAELNSLRVSLISLDEPTPILANNYLHNS